jgi:effector-binding domain-containing protein
MTRAIKQLRGEIKKFLESNEKENKKPIRTYGMLQR